MKCPSNKFVVVDADNWQALYVDGECVEQHHEVDLVGQLRQHGVDIVQYGAYEDPSLEDGGFSDNLSEVKFDKGQKMITEKKKTCEELLEKDGWTIECESPFEIRNTDGSFASGQAAHILLDYYRNGGNE